MCVRYLSPDKMKEVQQIVDALGNVSIRVPENELAARANPEVGPGVTAPIIVIGRIMISGKWGFVKWDGKGLVFNARCESLTTSQFFSPHIMRGRCLVPATAYFEWEHGPGGKRGRKYRIRAANGGMLFMAGLGRRHPQLGVEYTVITRNAMDSVKSIHDRMPLLLDRESSLQWLAPEWNPQLLKQESVKVLPELAE
ncbi:MAG: SOS response-associated peptidase [Lentisphaeria bacterium]|nr:SOS response-associated peptidase [Lentisphaeria bacterium]